MVENVYSTRIKREQQRVPVTRHLKRDSYNFVTEMTRDGDDILNLKPLQFKTYQQYRCLNSLKSCGAPIRSR